MNLGAGQPAPLPYGVEPQWWYSYHYHSMQFSSPPQQSPISSVCYHSPPPGNYPSPNHYPPPGYFTKPNPYTPPLHFAQLNSYPPPPTPNPYSAYAYQPHFIPTNQFVPPHTTHEPPHTSHEPPPNPQRCSVLPQLDHETDPEVAIVESSHSSSQFSDARLDEFIDSVSRLLDKFAMDIRQVSEVSSPSVSTPTTKLQSSEPRVCSPLRLQPVTKPSSPLGNAQSATGGVKKPRRSSLGIVAPRAVGKYRKCKPQFVKMMMETVQQQSAQLEAKRVSGVGGPVPASTTSPPDLGEGDHGSASPSTVACVNGTSLNHCSTGLPVKPCGIGCNAIDFVFGDKLTSIDVACDNEKRKSSDMKVKMQNRNDNEFSKLEGDSVKGDEHGPNLHVKGREFCALHLLDEMSRSDGFCNAGRRVAALTSIRDKGGGLIRQSLDSAIGSVKQDAHGPSLPMKRSREVCAPHLFVEAPQSDDMYYTEKTVAFHMSIRDKGGGHPTLCESFDATHVSQLRPAVLQQPVPPRNTIGTFCAVHQMSIAHGEAAPSLQYGIPSMYDMTLNRSTFQSQLSTRAVAGSTRKYGSVVSKIVIKGALCRRLKHHTEGTRKISHCGMLLCFLGFDKKVRDKGSGDPLIMDGHVVIGNEFEGNIKLLLVCMSNFITAIGNSEKMALEVIASNWVFESYLISIDHEAKVRGGMDTLLGVITDGTYILLLTEDICSDGWMELVVLRHVQSGLRIALLMVMDDLNVTDDQLSRIFSCIEIITPATFLCVVVISCSRKQEFQIILGIAALTLCPLHVFTLQFIIVLADIESGNLRGYLTAATLLDKVETVENLMAARKISLKNILACKCLFGLQSSAMALLICWYGYSKIVLENGTTYAAFLCICWITSDSLSEQLHNYHKALEEPTDVIELESCHGYFVLLGIAACLDSNIIYDGDFDYNIARYNAKRRGKTSGAFSMYMEPEHVDKFCNDRNGGVMVDNEDVRAALVEHKNETRIGEDNVADRDRDFVNPPEKYVFLQQPWLVKKTSSINCPPRFAVQLEWLYLLCVTYLKLEVKFREGGWIVMNLGLFHSRVLHMII